MPLSSITEVPLGKKISFSSKSAVDPTVWTGTLSAFLTYDAARPFGDLVAYHANVLRQDATLMPIEQLKFFLMTIEEKGAPLVFRAFANEWITPGSLNLVEQRNEVRVLVYDLPANDPDAILNVLRQAGYPCVIESVTNLN